MESLQHKERMKALRNYAKEKGVPISELTPSEKEKFLKANPLAKKAANL